MAAVSLAIVGKSNQPIYLKEFVPEVGALDDESVLFGILSLAPLPDNNMRAASKKCFDISLKQEFLLHAALDRFEEVSGPPPGYQWRSRPGADGMYMGLLMVVNELRIYGYCTTTKNKFFLIVEDESLSPQQQRNADDDIKSLLKVLHQLFVEELLNPFKSLEDMTVMSPRFESQLQNYISAFNQSEGMI